MPYLRMWKSDGAARLISLEDAADWFWRNARYRENERPDRSLIEARLRRGDVLETPAALIGSDRRRMESTRDLPGEDEGRQAASDKLDIVAERRRRGRLGGF